MVTESRSESVAPPDDQRSSGTNPNAIARRAQDAKEDYDSQTINVGVQFSKYTDITVVIHCNTIVKPIRELMNEDGVYVGDVTTDGDLVKVELRESGFSMPD